MPANRWAALAVILWQAFRHLARRARIAVARGRWRSKRGRPLATLSDHLLKDIGLLNIDDDGNQWQ
ncbi:MAG TPA: hypothetical protein VN229_22495 [Terriglobales bacterium]|nr:hypothetical protein [Terriglobales bacterium]